MKPKERFDLQLGNGVLKTSPRSDKKEDKDRDSTIYYLGFLSQLGTGIAVPIALGALIGAWLDSKWATKPTATLSGLAIGFVLSLVYFVRTILDVLREEKNHTG